MVVFASENPSFVEFGEMTLTPPASLPCLRTEIYHLSNVLWVWGKTKRNQSLFQNFSKFYRFSFRFGLKFDVFEDWKSRSNKTKLYFWQKHNDETWSLLTFSKRVLRILCGCMGWFGEEWKTKDVDVVTYGRYSVFFLILYYGDSDVYVFFCCHRLETSRTVREHGHEQRHGETVWQNAERHSQQGCCRRNTVCWPFSLHIQPDLATEEGEFSSQYFSKKLGFEKMGKLRFGWKTNQDAKCNHAFMRRSIRCNEDFYKLGPVVKL